MHGDPGDGSSQLRNLSDDLADPSSQVHPSARPSVRAHTARRWLRARLTRVDTRPQRMFALLASLLLAAAAVPSAATSRSLTATGPGVTFPCLSVQQARVRSAGQHPTARAGEVARARTR